MPRAGKTPLTPKLHKQTLTFAGSVLSQLPLLTMKEQQRYIGNPSLLARRLRDALVEKVNAVAEIRFEADLVRWTAIYQKLFGQTPGFSGLVIPAKPEGQGPMRLIVVAREIIDWTGNKPLQGTLFALKKYFPCWQYADDLDKAITTNDRDPKNGSYALWVKDVREADAENANLSASDLLAKNHLGLTVLERMLLEADYFFEHGEHLDLQNWTLCDGSRFSDGSVSHACWLGGEFSVYWCFPTSRYSYLRSRRAYL